AGAAGPDLELFDRRRAECVRRADQWLSPLTLQKIRELADRRRLPSSVHTNNQGHRRRRADDEWPVDRIEDAANLLLDQIAQAASSRTCVNGIDDAAGGRHADVG